MRDFFLVERDEPAGDRRRGRRRWPPSGSRATTTSTRSRRQVLARCTGAGRHRRVQRRAARAPQPRRRGASRGTALPLGDRVMQTRNNHERRAMNGSSASLVDQRPGARRARCWSATTAAGCGCARRTTGTLRLAYACTRPQGAGLAGAGGRRGPAPARHAPMLTRNLLYTAMTRSHEGLRRRRRARRAGGGARARRRAPAPHAAGRARQLTPRAIRGRVARHPGTGWNAPARRRRGAMRAAGRWAASARCRSAASRRSPRRSGAGPSLDDGAGRVDVAELA